jgi:hypothetical protein
MNSNTQKIDNIIQYSLLIAGEEDEYLDQQLGPIHFIKYVYIADLEFARRNNGQTFTSTKWQFYNFGPWSQDVRARIEPALKAVMAEKYVFESQFGDNNDCIRGCSGKHL